MFAFAIWDDIEKNLFAARDRFGEKPFFFYYDNAGFVFASELKALWKLGVKKELNEALLYNFLTIGYTTNPGDPGESFYGNIRKLPAANFLRYTPADQKLETEKYWQVYPEVNYSISENEAIEKFRGLFSASVHKRLRSDVAIGTSLSGGLDSSSVVAFCNHEVSDHYSHQCFTASFKGFERDELQWAQRLASKFGLTHHVIEMEGNGIVPLMGEVMRFQEEPFATASVLAQYKVYECAKEKGVTVLLDGQGADEVLAGYHAYYKWYWQELYRKRKLGKSAELKAASKLGVHEKFGLKNKVFSFLPELGASLLQSGKSKSAFRSSDLDRDFAYTNKRNFYYSLPHSFDLNGALFFDTFVHGLEELLRLADRNSMAHGREIRLPFLSHELVEFLFTLPSEFKIRNGWTKWLLRKSVEHDLPSELTWRKDKVGFEPPQEAWMKNKEVQQAMMHAKQKLVDHHILNREVLGKKIKPHSSYAAGSEWKYWSASFLFED
jgi:asparagine synthase (glutamine-hydrolysing)